MKEAVFESAAPTAIAGHRNWRHYAVAVAAILLGIIFLVSGGWKVLEPYKTGELLEQARVPAGFGTIGASVLGTLELFTALLLFTPRYRKLGGLLGSALMIFFIGWIAFYYQQLVGKECSCFPIIKRAVGPGFFVSDAVFLLFGLVAAAWAPAVKAFRVPVMMLAAVAVLAGASLGVGAMERRNLQMPYPVMVDGKPTDLRTGKVFLFFYDPMCSHCDAASKFLSTLTWKDTRIIAIPTNDPQFAAAFLHDTHLKADTSLDGAKLRAKFSFVNPPYGVALVDGRVKESFEQAQFNAPSPKAQLSALGFVQ
ncbi:MAG: MauE/DoxX family redox-associated membrane protein [Bryobacteraceae bacterium]